MARKNMRPDKSRDQSKDRPGSFCRRIRGRLDRIIAGRCDSDDGWIKRHIADCPKCQKRFAVLGRVDLALSLIKAQPHKLDLLARANDQAVGVLKHSLRSSPKAGQLRTAFPKPTVRDRLGNCYQAALNAAACLAILFLLKIGIFSSMSVLEDQGSKAVENYYVRSAGRELSDDIFNA